MKYVAIDIETTGIDPNKHQILEFGAILEDTEINQPIQDLPVFQRYIKHNSIIGSDFALQLNKEIIQYINNNQLSSDVIFPENLFDEFIEWLDNFIVIDKIVLAGKNIASFDIQFLNKLSNWDSSIFHHRTIDPTFYYTNFENDDVPPSLEMCLERAGINKNVSHRAVDDAMDIVNLIRIAIHGENIDQQEPSNKRYKDDCQNCGSHVYHKGYRLCKKCRKESEPLSLKDFTTNELIQELISRNISPVVYEELYYGEVLR